MFLVCLGKRLLGCQPEGWGILSSKILLRSHIHILFKGFLDNLSWGKSRGQLWMSRVWVKVTGCTDIALNLHMNCSTQFHSHFTHLGLTPTPRYQRGASSKKAPILIPWIGLKCRSSKTSPELKNTTKRIQRGVHSYRKVGEITLNKRASLRTTKLGRLDEMDGKNVPTWPFCAKKTEYFWPP